MTNQTNKHGKTTQGTAKRTESAGNLTRQEIIKSIAEKASVTQKQASALLDAFYDVLCESVTAGKGVVIPNFISIKLRHTGERTARNPQTNAAVIVPAGTRVVITAGKGLKTAANTAA